MQETQLAEKLAFLLAHHQLDEVTLLAQAVRQGIQLLYREALIEAYLLGQLCREKVAQEIGSEALDDIDYQRDTLQRDVHWGMHGV
jgi:hypothetical protein